MSGGRNPDLPAQAGQGSASQRAGSSLRVSANGRYLAQRNGKPFFWLGDTAWLLFQIPTREEAGLYLKTRARQGFTIIQAAIVMGEERVGGTLIPNAYGDKAFLEGNPSRPVIEPGQSPRNQSDYDYWDHADYIISRARAHGLILGLLPLFVGYNGDGYKYMTPRNAESYGLFLSRRYRHQSHLLWILGGDNTPDTEEKRAVGNTVARGIAVGMSGSEDYGRALMTYHINGKQFFFPVASSGSLARFQHDPGLGTGRGHLPEDQPGLCPLPCQADRTWRGFL
ncbi:MAG: DUF4038 domain-containing protein [Armatimonadetes bacterium]|nr:DUF4038 domain-containing protein [Armatimonadota bacterium]